MIEVEIKLKISDPDDIKNKLLTLGFSEHEFLTETDTYFDNKNGDIRNSDKALRIRETINHTTNKHFCQVNFKGEKYDNKSMTRPEFETCVENADALLNIINGIGFYSVEPKVIKMRHVLINSTMKAYIDSVKGLGDFLELEIVTDNEESKDKELNRINSILVALGYSMTDTTTTSYLSALQKKLESI